MSFICSCVRPRGAAGTRAAKVLPFAVLCSCRRRTHGYFGLFMLDTDSAFFVEITRRISDVAVRVLREPRAAKVRALNYKPPANAGGP